VLPDDTLISMASGTGEDWYAISFISYEKSARRAGFSQFAKFMAQSTSKLFHARPHWGKVCPLEADELTSLYPRFGDFCIVCNEIDPQGVFQNDWTAELLASASDPSGVEALDEGGNPRERPPGG
jgi:L-gulonolactone oxidase